MELRNILFFLISFLFVSGVHSEYKEKYGLIRSCSGWQLNKHPILKSFLKDNVTDYDVDVVFPGGAPVFIVMDPYGNEISSTPLANLKVEEIVKLLEDNGFGKIQQS